MKYKHGSPDSSQSKQCYRFLESNEMSRLTSDNVLWKREVKYQNSGGSGDELVEKTEI